MISSTLCGSVGIAACTCDADGLRTRKTVNGVRTNYIWSGGNIVAEITGDKIVTYLYGLNRISRKITGPKYVGTHVERDGETGEIISETPIEFYRELYIYDGHGSVVQTVSENIDKYIGDTQYHKGSGGAAEEFDADGDNVVDVSDIILFLSTYPVVRSYHYDAFGNQLSELADYDTNPFRYCGEYWDKESNETNISSYQLKEISEICFVVHPHFVPNIKGNLKIKNIHCEKKSSK